jgi:hypothetical protein
MVGVSSVPGMFISMLGSMGCVVFGSGMFSSTMFHVPGVIHCHRVAGMGHRPLRARGMFNMFMPGAMRFFGMGLLCVLRMFQRCVIL